MLHLEIFFRHKGKYGTREVPVDAGLFNTEGPALLRKLQPLLREIDSRRQGHGLLQETSRQAAFCTQCGTALEESAEFCTNCGTRVADAPPEKKKRPILVACLGCGCASMVGFVLLVGVLIWLGMSVMSQLAKENYYTMGIDRIPSVKLALGEEREIRGLDDGKNVDGDPRKEITYKVPGTQQGREMQQYVAYLCDKDGFFRLGEIDFSGPTGEGLLARFSIDSSYVVLVKIQYDTDGYTIVIVRQKPNAILSMSLELLKKSATNPPDEATWEPPAEDTTPDEPSTPDEP
jgi:hypothetical protein